MTFGDKDLPPYEPRRILSAPFAEKVRLVCRMWAAQVAPNPPIVLVMYWLKYILFFAGGWAFFASFSQNYPGFWSGQWVFTDVAFQKAIIWALFYEVIGLGCASGPMNARFNPPIGGLLYFLRPGTTKMPLSNRIPLIGGIQRNWFDVLLFAALMVSLLRALVAPAVTPELVLPTVILVAVFALTDKTVFLAARAEHYWVVLVGLAFATGAGLWVSVSKAVWCAIWFWAATSKLNHHFPSVIMFMVNNGPLAPKWFKKKLFVDYIGDLRPSTFAKFIAHSGTFVEYMIPVILLSSDGGMLTLFGLVLMAGFHSFIGANNPSGMPVEWNILMIYGGIFLFGYHAEVGVLPIGSIPLLAFFVSLWTFAIPCFGNFFPANVSFLLSMRYYAGNWAYNIWLVRPEAMHKFDKLTKPAGTMRQQLQKMLDDEEQVEMGLAMSLAHRFLHIEGRPLLEALPRAVDDIEQYEWMEGEVLGGSIIGWNFGDGHLNSTQLLHAVQAQCDFEEGEVRVVVVESQPLFGSTMSWRVIDARTGLHAAGRTEISHMLEVTPYPTGKYAEALKVGSGWL
ncbi:MAG: DUF3556 domain-containing protein [Candidatus Binatia bacterium]|nr:DUF3556 domain-containing protein [Candidatus Binatia bacterium]